MMGSVGQLMPMSFLEVKKIVTYTVIIFCFFGATSAISNEVLINSSSSYTAQLFKDIDLDFSKKFIGNSGHKIQVRTHNDSPAAETYLLKSIFSSDVISPESSIVLDKIMMETNALRPNWQNKFANNSSPYFSTIVFVVHTGNPKRIINWDDLVNKGVSLVFASPHFSSIGRYAYLGAMVFAHQKYEGDENKSKIFLHDLLVNRVLWRSGPNVINYKFFSEGIGDVLVTYESDALYSVNRYGSDRFQVVYPSLNIITPFPIAIMDEVVDRRGNRNVAKAYIDFIYSKDGQSIIANNYYRPGVEGIVDTEATKKFPQLNKISIDSILAGWIQAHPIYFENNGEFSKIENDIMKDELMNLK